MDYQITATLGPGSATPTLWQALLATGVTAFRLNTSHLSLGQLLDWLERLAVFGASLEAAPPLVLDLQGSKWRLGEFPACEVVAGQRVTLVYAPATNQFNVLPVPHPDFFQAAMVSSGEVTLNDARVRLKVEKITPEKITAQVTQGGQLSARKGITCIDSTYRQETLSERDQAIVAQTGGVTGIRYALSYVKDAAEMARYRAQLGPAAYLIAKLERQPAVEQMIALADLADELWLCRGDLGAELGLTGMAAAAAHCARLVPSSPAPVLLAGQVLEHMTAHPTPTRSEVCHLYDILRQGYHGLVLSDETAIGQYPVESARIAAMFRAET